MWYFYLDLPLYMEFIKFTTTIYGGAVLMIPVVIVLLIITLAQGTTIGGTIASRWIRILFVGIGFQTSTLAGLVLMVYLARYLAKNKHTKIIFKESLWKLYFQ